MENSSGKHNKARRGSKAIGKAVKERDLMYARIEQKFEISQKEIRDHHKKFLREQKKGEMSRDDFMKYAESERIKPFVAQSLFRIFDEDGSGTIDFEEFIMIVNFKNTSTYEDKLEWIFKVFDEDGGGTIDIDELIKIVIGLFNMNGESLDREVILACVIELMDIIDEDGNGEITRDEFIQNGMKSGFIRNLMEFFDQDDPNEQSKQTSVEKKTKVKPNEKDHQESEEDCS